MSENATQLQSSIEQGQPQGSVENDIYMRIWEGELQYMKTRWSIVTFFMSISFGILAFSFQEQFHPSTALAIRITALFIYWFSCFMYLHLYQITKALRTYLTEMEAAGRATIHIQSKVWHHAFRSKILVFHSFRTHTVLIIFGVIYAVGIIVLQVLGL